MRSVLISALRERLAAAGFRPVPAPRGEEVHERAHNRDPRYAVQIIQRHDDAIRVVALLTVPPNVVRPVFQADRIPPSGPVEEVLDRVIERAREAYAAINRHRLAPSNHSPNAGAVRCRST
jgi:hypothetical protein